MRNKVLFIAKSMLFVAIFTLGSHMAIGQTLIYYWNFNDNIPPTNTNWDQPIAATIGAAEITYTFTEVYSFTGTAFNGVWGEMPGGSLVPRGGADTINNGEHFTLTVPTTGYENIELKYPTRRTSTGFTTQEIQYSIDGSTWISNETIDISEFGNNWAENQIITINFSGISGVNNNENFSIRIILTGATSAAGNNRFDNIIISGSQLGAVPPPSNFAASSVSTSQINLSWNLNANNDPVLLAWSNDGIFGEPAGSYNVGDPISGGGTVIYTGSDIFFAHEGLEPGTLYYYMVWSNDGNDYSPGVSAQATTMPMPATTTLPYNEDFEEDLGDCYVYSVSGPSKFWNQNIFGGNGYAQMNGFNSGELEEDWMILPGINFDNYNNETMVFETWWRFGNDDDNNYLNLFYSDDYPGTGDPSSSNWHELEFTRPSEDQTWASSGSIDLSGITGGMIYIGFKYRYEPGNYKWWQVDAISIIGTPTGIDRTEMLHSSINIGPNPSAGLVTITLPEAGFDIRVYNLVGNIVTEVRAAQKSFVLDMRSHSKGIYIIEVVLADGSMPVRSKMVLQ